MSTETKSPGTVSEVADGSYGWIDLDNIKTDDNNAGAANVGSSVGGTEDSIVKIIKSNGDLGSTNKAKDDWQSSKATSTYGGSEDLWDETWSATDINNSNFGVALKVDFYDDYEWTNTRTIKATNFGFEIPSGATINGIEVTIKKSCDGEFRAYIYYIEITIHYELSKTGPFPTFFRQ